MPPAHYGQPPRRPSRALPTLPPELLSAILSHLLPTHPIDHTLLLSRTLHALLLPSFYAFASLRSTRQTGAFLKALDARPVLMGYVRGLELSEFVPALFAIFARCTNLRSVRLRLHDLSLGVSPEELELLLRRLPSTLQHFSLLSLPSSLKPTILPILIRALVPHPNLHVLGLPSLDPDLAALLPPLDALRRVDLPWPRDVDDVRDTQGVASAARAVRDIADAAPENVREVRLDLGGRRLGHVLEVLLEGDPRARELVRWVNAGSSRWVRPAQPASSSSAPFSAVASTAAALETTPALEPLPDILLSRKHPLLLTPDELAVHLIRRSAPRIWEFSSVPT